MFKKAECIAFANLKGGTGKTTTCINIAGYLVKNSQARNVLVVDFDPQANATSGLGIDGTTLDYSIYDAVLDRCEEYEGVPITKIIVETDVKKLHLAPSELNLGAAPMLMQTVSDRIGILNSILEPIRQFYDYILIDVPSDAGWFMLNSLRVADRLIVPVDSSIFALESLENLKVYCRDIERVTGHTIEEFILVSNRYAKAKNTSRSARKLSPSEEIQQILAEMSEQTFIIPESVLIYRSQQEGLPISHSAPTSLVGKAYEAIANHLIK